MTRNGGRLLDWPPCVEVDRRYGIDTIKGIRTPKPNDGWPAIRILEAVLDNIPNADQMFPILAMDVWHNMLIVSPWALGAYSEEWEQCHAQ